MEIICMVGCFVGVVVLATAPVGQGGVSSIFNHKNLTNTAAKSKVIVIGKPVTIHTEHATSIFHAHNMTHAMKMLGLDKYQSNEAGYLTGLGCMVVAAWS